MDLVMVNDWLDNHTGEFSLFFQQYKGRLKKYEREEFYEFFGEFMFFEQKYLAIRKHMLENQIVGEIIDIGCQFGFQSEFFLDNPSYIGIDVYPHIFFNSDKPNVQYMVGSFPGVEVNIKDKTVFSIMSLGYFQRHIDEDEEKALHIVVSALKDLETLYISTTDEVFNALLPYFDTVENICPSITCGKQYHTFYMGKKKLDTTYPRAEESYEHLKLKTRDKLVIAIKKHRVDKK